MMAVEVEEAHIPCPTSHQADE